MTWWQWLLIAVVLCDTFIIFLGWRNYKNKEREEAQWKEAQKHFAEDK